MVSAAAITASVPSELSIVIVVGAAVIVRSVVTFVILAVFSAIAANISSVITPQDDAVAAGNNVLVPVELVIVRDVALAILPRLVSTFTSALASILSSFVLSVPVSKPASDVVAAGIVASVPSDDVTVPFDAAVV